jgi:hypothetical protein
MMISLRRNLLRGSGKQRRPAPNQQEIRASRSTKKNVYPDWYMGRNSLEANLPYLFHVKWKPYTKYVKVDNDYFYDDEQKPEEAGIFDNRVFKGTTDSDLGELHEQFEIVTKQCGPDLIKILESMLFGDNEGQGRLKYMPDKGCTQNGSSWTQV